MRVGSRVKCIDDSILAGQEDFVAKAYQNWVKKDEEYIIREVFENAGIVNGIVLEGLYNLPIYQPLICAIQEPAFRSSRFAELQDPEEVSEEVAIESFVKNFGPLIEGL